MASEQSEQSEQETLIETVVADVSAVPLPEPVQEKAVDEDVLVGVPQIEPVQQEPAVQKDPAEKGPVRAHPPQPRSVVEVTGVLLDSVRGVIEQHLAVVASDEAEIDRMEWESPEGWE